MCVHFIYEKKFSIFFFFSFCYIYVISRVADRPKKHSSEGTQRYPYLQEMKELLLSNMTPTDSMDMERLDGTPVKEANQHNDHPTHTNPGVIPEPPEMPPDSLIGTVVKVRFEDLRQITLHQAYNYDTIGYCDVKRAWINNEDRKT